MKAFGRCGPSCVPRSPATDPAASTTAPPAPWHGIFDAPPIHARYYLVHLVEECARHAGHADTIREQIDGVAVPGLVSSLRNASGTSAETALAELELVDPHRFGRPAA
jgi:uncharacterized protein DUF664